MSVEQDEMFGGAAAPQDTGSIKNLWSTVDKWASKSRAEFERTKSAIEDVKGWKFNGVVEGIFWTATHRDLGRIQANTSSALLMEVGRVIAGAKAKGALRGGGK